MSRHPIPQRQTSLLKVDNSILTHECQDRIFQFHAYIADKNKEDQEEEGWKELLQTDWIREWA